jgi:glycosyltransferase involved in cell wall biosynthesis
MSVPNSSANSATQTSMRPIRILHVFGAMNRGGAETRTLELMRNIDRTLFQFEFCCVSGMTGALDDEIRSLGGAVHLIKWELGFTRRFQQLLRQREFGVVHSHLHHFSGYILRQAARQRIPMRIAHYRVAVDDRPNVGMRRMYVALMKHWISKFATHILAVSEDAMNRGWSETWRSDLRCRVIYNGVECHAYDRTECRHQLWQELNLAANELVCINVARMAPHQKNHERLIEIFAAVSRRVSPITLLIVGLHPQEYREKLLQISTKLGCTGRILFLGVRADVRRLMTAADLMIFPTFYEGLPGVVLEACVAGLPVLASDIPPIAEIARYLKGVHPLPLSAPNSKWGEAALQLLESCRARSAKETAIDLANSPFDVRTSLQALEQIYASSSVLKAPLPAQL